MPSEPSWRRIAVERYGLDRAKLIEERTHHSRHYFISVNNVRYVLSQVRRSPERPPFPLQFRIIDLLIAAGVDSVRHPVPTLNRDKYTQDQNCYWFLRAYRHTDTVFWSASPGLVTQAAHALADVHRAGHVGNPAVTGLHHPRRHGMAPYYRTVDAFLGTVDTIYRGFDTSALTGDDCDLLDRTLARLRHDSRDVLDTAREHGLCGITHHDYRPDNLLVRHGRIAEIIDWDCAFVDHQLYDVGFAALQFGQRQRLRDSSLGHAELFIKEYLAVRRITNLPEAVTWWFLRFVVVKRLLINGSNAERIRLLHAIEEHRPLARAAQPAH
jgi:hypothetical protein